MDVWITAVLFMLGLARSSSLVCSCSPFAPQNQLQNSSVYIPIPGWSCCTLPFWPASILCSSVISRVCQSVVPKLFWKLHWSSEGIRLLQVQLLNFGMSCLNTLDKPPLQLCLNYCLNPTSFLWPLTRSEILLFTLSFYFVFLSLYCCCFYLSFWYFCTLILRCLFTVCV